MSTTEQANEIHLKVEVLYNGAVQSFPYRPHEHVLVLLDEARRAFGITTNPHLMALFNVAGQELNDGQSLTDAHVNAGDELILRQSIVRGG